MADRETEVIVELEEEFSSFLGGNFEWIKNGYTRLLSETAHLNPDNQQHYIMKFLSTLLDQEFVKDRDIPRFVKVRWVETMFKRLENL